MRPLSAVIARARCDGVLRSANTVQVGNNDKSQAAPGPSRAGSLRTGTVSSRGLSAEQLRFHAATDTRQKSPGNPARFSYIESAFRRGVEPN